MKSVCITGSARGLGLCMAKEFRKHDFNIMLSDLDENNLIKAKETLDKIKGKGMVSYCVCDVSNSDSIKHLINNCDTEFKGLDIFINNAGVNQGDKNIWELERNDINKLIDIDLKGCIYGSREACKYMINQGHGAIYNVEGHGSNNAIIPGLSMYGTSKHAVTYFTDCLAKELENSGKNLIIGKLSPGIMITDFLTNSVNNKQVALSDKNKKVYNILGDYPDVIAKFLVNKMVNNNKNGIRFSWLTNFKACFRFMTCMVNKRNFFE